MNVLITSASRKVGLIKAFQYALRKEGGGSVIAVDMNRRSAALYCADHSYIVPSSTNAGFFDTISGICHKHEVKIIIPTRDEELPVFANEREHFEKAGIKVMVSNPETISTCQDKKRFIDFCIKKGFTVPKTFDLNEISPDTGFPLFMRERFGKGSKNAFCVTNFHEFEYLKTHMEDPVIQQFIDAPEYTVDLFADFSGRIISVVPRERLTIVGGESFIAITRKKKDIIEETIRLARALNIVGHATIQCFHHEGRVKFIEVNPRYGGGANLSFAAGACTPAFLIRLLSNKVVDPCIGDFKDNFMMLRYTRDIFVSDEEMNRIEDYP